MTHRSPLAAETPARDLTFRNIAREVSIEVRVPRRRLRERGFKGQGIDGFAGVAAALLRGEAEFAAGGAGGKGQRPTPVPADVIEQYRATCYY
jgi:hypothetical protein